MTNFSVTIKGKVLDPGFYNWDEKTKTFSSDVDGLVLDFTDIDGVTFNTGSFCTFITGSRCTFKTSSNCTFDTGNYCTFKTSSNCTFDTGHYCPFNTGSDCTFKTGYSCTFKTGSDCTFKTGSSCIFEVGDNCSLIRYDVKGVTEIPTGKKIKLNGHGIAGIEEKKEIEIEILKEIKELQEFLQVRSTSWLK
jgi:hypothetical protein